jgi:hypothetical protein
MAFPSLSGEYDKFELALLDDTAYELAAYELLDFSGGSYRMNVTGLKPYGSNRQNFKGDATYVVDNLRFTIRVKGARGVSMASLLAELKATKFIQMGSSVLEIAHAVGINSWVPLGAADTRVEVEFIPATPFWDDSEIAVA